jgi:hypothetical protein
LRELGALVTTLGVDVVRHEILPVVQTTRRRVGIALAIGMEGRPTKICVERRIRQPSSIVVKLTLSLFHFPSFFFLGRRQNFLLLFFF